MKWFKHDSTASMDAKLKRVRIKYGMAGYGLYWYCLELIAQGVESHNLSFELEHDCEVLAHDTGINYQLVQEMMGYMVDLGLFENSAGRITCLKMAARLDQSMTGNSKMRSMIAEIKENHDLVMTSHDAVMLEEKRREEKRKEKNKTPKALARPDDVCEQVWDDFITHRKRLKANLTETALNGIIREANKAGVTLEAALAECVLRGWRGFKADWVKPDEQKGFNASPDRLRNRTYSDDLNDTSWAGS